jgi:hypothetical protein
MEYLSFSDKISNIMLANNLVYHVRTKHIVMYYDFVREKVLARDFNLVYVSTKEQVRDVFTKLLGIEKFHILKSLLGVLEMDLSLRGSVKISSSTPLVTLFHVTNLVYCTCGVVVF